MNIVFDASIYCGFLKCLQREALHTPPVPTTVSLSDTLSSASSHYLTPVLSREFIIVIKTHPLFFNNAVSPSCDVVGRELTCLLKFSTQ